MPKMTRWNSPEPIEVSAEKAAVYASQGWVNVPAPAKKVQPGMVREAAAAPVADSPETGSAAPAPVKKPEKKPAKKAASKKS